MGHPQFSFELLLRRIVFQEAYLHPNDLVYLEFDEGKILYSTDVDAKILPTIVTPGDEVKITVTFVPCDSVSNYLYSPSHLKVALLTYSDVVARGADLRPTPRKKSIVEVMSWTHQFRTSFTFALSSPGMDLYQSLGPYQNLDDVLAEISIEPEGLFL